MLHTSLMSFLIDSFPMLTDQIGFCGVVNLALKISQKVDGGSIAMPSKTKLDFMNGRTEPLVLQIIIYVANKKNEMTKICKHSKITFPLKRWQYAFQFHPDSR